jgi:flavin reductase (DIM6/NTAB) family NADH-FMN oxidoreductase RutF
MVHRSCDNFHFYRPSEGHRLPHDPIKSIVAPRPIGWISTRAHTGDYNLAPYSFFNVFSYRPPIVGFCSLGRKDSLRNVEATGEFTWNLATRELADAMHQTAAQCDADTDEFKLAGLTPVAGRIVAAPLVAESPVAFECQCSQIIQLRSAAGDPIDAWLVLGEVQGIHIDKTLLEDGIYNTAKARPVLRGGPPAEYFEVTAESLFRLSLRNGTVT